MSSVDPLAEVAVFSLRGPELTGSGRLYRNIGSKCCHPAWLKFIPTHLKTRARRARTFARACSVAPLSARMVNVPHFGCVIVLD